MEIFGYLGWFSLPQYFLQFISIPCENEIQFVENNLMALYICLGVACGLYLIGHIFGGIGLLKISRRAGVKYGWIGFLPFGCTYLTGKLAGQTTMFNTKVKRMGLYAMIAEILFVGLNVLWLVVNYYPLQTQYVSAVVNSAEQIVGYGIDPDLLPQSLTWMVTAADVLEYVNYIFELIVLFMLCMMFNAFFRKYYVRSPFMMTFLCALLPARGFAIFAVRNNTPVDYNAYMQKKMQEAAARRQAYYGPGYGGGYGPQNGQGGYGSGPAEDPFSDFGGSNAPNNSGGQSGGSSAGGDSPFSDF